MNDLKINLRQENRVQIDEEKKSWWKCRTPQAEWKSHR